MSSSPRTDSERQPQVRVAGERRDRRRSARRPRRAPGRPNRDRAAAMPASGRCGPSGAHRMVVALAPQVEIDLGQLEAVGRPHHGLEARTRPQWPSVALADAGSSRTRSAQYPTTTPQLVELGDPEPVGVEDDHHGGVGHVHAHLDDRGGDQHVEGTRIGRGPWPSSFSPGVTRPCSSRGHPQRLEPARRPGAVGGRRSPRPTGPGASRSRRWSRRTTLRPGAPRRTSLAAASGHTASPPSGVVLSPHRSATGVRPGGRLVQARGTSRSP